MDNWLDRTKNLIGEDAIAKLKTVNIAIIGIGGVGSFCAESLIRSGIYNITIIDNDNIDITNINRQIHADTTTIGKPKVIIMKNRILNINPEANVNAKQIFINKENTPSCLSDNFDYIIDCIDNVKSKIALIKYCYDNNINIISCMGTGNKIDPSKFLISDIFKTSVCPLAKIIRKELKKLNINKLKVLYSTEEPKKTNTSYPSSISFMPSIAGLIISSEVIKDLINL